MGIAEQSLVSTAAGMARCGLRPFAASPASFLSTRSMEQVKVDVAYSHTNVKLIGISGGISYGALGMTHHSAQDIAALASIPGLAGKNLCAGTIDAWLVYKLTGGSVFARTTPTPPAPSCSTCGPFPGTKRSAAGSASTPPCCRRCASATASLVRRTLGAFCPTLCLSTGCWGTPTAH